MACNFLKTVNWQLQKLLLYSANNITTCEFENNYFINLDNETRERMEACTMLADTPHIILIVHIDAY